MAVTLVTTQHIERPGAAAQISYARFVTDGAGLRIELTGTVAAVLIADGAGMKVNATGTAVANLVRVGDAIFILDI